MVNICKEKQDCWAWRNKQREWLQILLNLGKDKQGRFCDSIFTVLSWRSGEVVRQVGCGGLQSAVRTAGIQNQEKQRCRGSHSTHKFFLRDASTQYWFKGKDGFFNLKLDKNFGFFAKGCGKCFFHRSQVGKNFKDNAVATGEITRLIEGCLRGRGLAETDATPRPAHFK
jgi:hypothetical protein